MTLRLRNARPEDAAALARLGEQLGGTPAPQDVARHLQRLVELGHAEITVAELDGEVVGFGHVRLDADLRGGPFAELVELVVDEGRRSAGVGAALLRRAEAWGRAQSLPWMRVRSRTTRTRAHAFYLRHGYALQKQQCVFVRALADSAGAEPG